MDWVAGFTWTEWQKSVEYARRHLVLQPRQGFGQQGSDRLARLSGECDQQVFLFRGQIKSIRIHILTIPRAPPLCKASPERDG